jgi:hypothetical protein
MRPWSHTDSIFFKVIYYVVKSIENLDGICYKPVSKSFLREKLLTVAFGDIPAVRAKPVGGRHSSPVQS